MEKQDDEDDEELADTGDTAIPMGILTMIMILSAAGIAVTKRAAVK